VIDFLKFVNQSDEDKYNMLLEGQAENQQLKSTLEEIRGFINTACSWLNIDLRDNDELLHVRALFFKELLQIIDKGE
jgi:hypothetical protein